MAEEEVGLRLALKNRHEVVEGLDDVGDKMNRAGDEAARAGRKARIGAGGFISMGKSGRLAGRAIVYGMGAAAAAVVGAGIVVTKLSKDSIAEAREAQKVGGATNRLIAATGKAANISAKGVGKLSTAISKKVGIDDEEIQSGANLVLMYKNVQNQQGKGNKIFNRAIRDATDMAAVTGTLTTNSKLLGKVLNDPLKAITGLTKAGVKFTDQQIKQITYDDKHNKLLDAQKIILGEVEDRVGGVAASQATWGEKASVTIGNLKEDFGTILLPLLDRTEKWFVQKGGPVIDEYIGKFEDKGVPAIRDFAGMLVDKGIPAVKDFADEARPIAESILPAIGTGFDAVKDSVKVIAPKMKAIFDGFNGLPDWAKEAVAIGAGSAVVAKKLGVGSMLFGGKGAGGAAGLLGGGRGASPASPVWVQVAGAGGLGGAPVPKPGPGGLPTWALGGAALGLGLGAVTGGGLVDSPGTKWYQNGVPKVDTKDVLTGPAAEKFLLDRSTAAFQKWFDAQTVGYVASSKALGHLISGTGQLDSTVGKAKNSTVQLFDVLTGVDRDWTPRLTIVGINDAESRLDSIQSKMTQLSYMGIGGSPAPSGGGGGGGKGSKGRHHSGRFATPDMPHIGDDFWDDGDDGPVQPIHVHLHVGRHEIGSVVLDDLDDRLARK